MTMARRGTKSTGDGPETSGGPRGDREVRRGQSAAQQFPPRDAHGRVASASEMAGAVVLLVALGTVLLIIVDGIGAAAGRGAFGHLPGWPAAILAVWMFIEDFRAWRIGPARAGVALVSAALGALGGVLVASLVGVLAPLWQGALGALVACLIYAMVWFFGIRALSDRISER
ncbi:MAG TPA: hypothetical protein VFR11_01950 [Micromonosporaceae bacterium]|nr:hypothetical protein [Micromonosporaceae bacterium]